MGRRARACICSIFERGSNRIEWNGWIYSPTIHRHQCRMRKTTGVRLKLIEFAPDMKRDDAASDYNLTWLDWTMDHGRRFFLFMLEMFSSINYAYMYMIWEESVVSASSKNRNIKFIFISEETTPAKWNIANSSKRLSEVSAPIPPIPSRCDCRTICGPLSFSPMSWIFLYFYDFYYILYMYNFC